MFHLMRSIESAALFVRVAEFSPVSLGGNGNFNTDARPMANR